MDTFLFWNGIGAAWFVGYVLTFARMLADFGDIDADYPELPPATPDGLIAGFACLSWMGFLAGVWVYFADRSKRPQVPFFRWTTNDLWQKHFDNPLAQEWYRMGIQ